jgi:Flp pilus assembly protein TadB
MNLNDPFGRVQQKQQRSYDSLRRSLLEAGVNTRAAAESVLRNLIRRAVVVTLVVALITAAVLLVLPEMGAAALMLAFVILFWLLATTVNGYSLVRRFIREEFSDPT